MLSITIPPIPFIDEQLGGTPFYEENRGNFAQARQIAEQCLTSARQSGDQPQMADALLAWGIVHLLQGEPVAALACLEEVHQQIPDDPGRRLRALNYAYKAMQLNYNFWPNGGVAMSRELTGRINLLEYAAQCSQRKEPLQAQIHDPALQLEEQLLNPWLLGAALSSPLYDDLDDDLDLRRTLANKLVEQRQQAEEKGAGSQALGILNLRAADALFKAGENQAALEVLDQAATLYRQSGDVIGEANCWMMQGDAKSAPVSTPLVWNCYLQEGTWNSALHWKIEALEADTSQIRLSEARQMYAQAEQIYRTGGVSRGVAAIELRYGYLETLERNYTRGTEHALRARDLFTTVGDILGVQVANAHHALCRIGMRPFPEDSATAEAIGVWGRTTGSLSFSLGLGLFFARVGRRWLMRDGDYERALACFRLAEALFRYLEMGSHQIQSMADQSTIYQMLGEPDAFATSVEHALDICDNLIASQPVLARSAWEQAAWMGMQLLCRWLISGPTPIR
jgi:tetratricopeptide (TPR) repeat protein